MTGPVLLDTGPLVSFLSGEQEHSDWVRMEINQMIMARRAGSNSTVLPVRCPCIAICRTVWVRKARSIGLQVSVRPSRAHSTRFF